jgi:hypothetical protein
MKYYEWIINGYQTPQPMKMKLRKRVRPTEKLPCPVCEGLTVVLDKRDGQPRKCVMCKDGYYLTK